MNISLQVKYIYNFSIFQSTILDVTHWYKYILHHKEITRDIDITIHLRGHGHICPSYTFDSLQLCQGWKPKYLQWPHLHKTCTYTQTRNHGGSPHILGFYEATHQVGETRSKSSFIPILQIHEHHIATLNNAIPRYFIMVHQWNLEHRVKVCFKRRFSISSHICHK